MSIALKRELEAVIASDVSAAALQRKMCSADLVDAVFRSFRTFPPHEFAVSVVYRDGLPVVEVHLEPQWLA